MKNPNLKYPVRTAREVARPTDPEEDLRGLRRLAKRRARFGLSLRNVERETGISSSQLSQIENHRRRISAKRAIVLARFYETTVEELFGAEELFGE